MHLNQDFHWNGKAPIATLAHRPVSGRLTHSSGVLNLSKGSWRLRRIPPLQARLRRTYEMAPARLSPSTSCAAVRQGVQTPPSPAAIPPLIDYTRDARTRSSAASRITRRPSTPTGAAWIPLSTCKTRAGVHQRGTVAQERGRMPEACPGPGVADPWWA